MRSNMGKFISNIDKGKTEKINSHVSDLEKLAGSTDGQRVKEMLDASNMSEAMESGDSEAVRKALAEILGTSEGQRLFGKINDMLK